MVETIIKKCPSVTPGFSNKLDTKQLDFLVIYEQCFEIFLKYSSADDTQNLKPFEL